MKAEQAAYVAVVLSVLIASWWVTLCATTSTTVRLVAATNITLLMGGFALALIIAKV